MNTPNVFDLLVVYNQSLSSSASDQDIKNVAPFTMGATNESYNQVYGYFLEICHRLGLVAAFSTSADIVGAGKCRSYWLFKNKQWKKVEEYCYSELIFDKFSPTNLKTKNSRQLLFSDDNIKPFNDPHLFETFFDKQETYNKLTSFSIPTISVHGFSLVEIKTACQQLAKITQNHSGLNDFSGQIIMKDRFGAGGRRIFKFDQNQEEAMLRKVKTNFRSSFVIQPLISFDKGFEYQGNLAATDIRLVFLNRQIVQTYIRRAKVGDYRCNEHQGGSLTYLKLNEIPEGLIALSKLISKKLSFPTSLYSLDFIISNNGNYYFLEGNTGPGLDWNLSLKKNEYDAKKLIRLVVGQLATLVESKAGSKKADLPLYSPTSYRFEYLA